MPETGHEWLAPELTAPAAFRHPRPPSQRSGDAGEHGPLDEPNRSFEDDLKIIAAILTAGYLRYRERRRRELPLDSAEASSPHGHEVNGTEKGE